MHAVTLPKFENNSNTHWPYLLKDRHGMHCIYKALQGLFNVSPNFDFLPCQVYMAIFSILWRFITGRVSGKLNSGGDEDGDAGILLFTW